MPLSHKTGGKGSLIVQKGDLGVNWRDEETFIYSIVKRTMKYLFLSLVFLLMGGCDDCVTYSAQAEYTVMYEVTGTASMVDLTIQNSNGGTSQYDNVSLPWTYTFKDIGDSFVYCSAQNQGQSGSVLVQIFIDDVLNWSSTSSGAFVIASAHGSVVGEYHTEEIEDCD